MSADGSGSWSAVWRIAKRDLNGRIRGLRLLFVCLFLGVATLATIGSLTSAITGELSSRGQTILGGDIQVEMSQREANADEKAAFAAEGELSETIRMQAMAQRVVSRGEEAGPDAILTELKGVDGAYPLYGALTLAGGETVTSIAPGTALIGPALADRLALSIGDTLRFGEAQVEIAGIIAEEPDRLGEGFTLGPVALVSLNTLRATRLILPGSLFESKYRIRIPDAVDPDAVRERLEDGFPTSGFEIDDRSSGAPGFARFIVRMGQFLTLVGLTALMIAGIGVGSGVSSYLGSKRAAIATFKTLGAASRDIMRIYLLQIAIVSLLGVAVGLLVGAFLPFAIVSLAGDVLPVRPGFALYPVPLLVSAAYGLLVALIFAWPPLARARDLPANALFRGAVELPKTRLGWTGWRNAIVPVLGIAAIVALVLVTARDTIFSAGFLAAAAGIMGLLALMGWLVRWAAMRAPRPKAPLARLALANLHRPGSATAQLVIALGLGLTLFAALATIQTSLTNEISRTVPQQAPNQFVLDVPTAEAEAFRALIEDTVPGAEVDTVPALRGTITEFAGTRVSDLTERPDGAWVLNGERGVTYAEDLPEGSELTDGEWWPADYDGPALVSFDQAAADALDLNVGDALTVSVLGREIEAEIASLRQINWDTLGFNYTMVFSPNALADAPHTLAATISLPETLDPVETEAGENALARGLLAAFPSVSVIAVGEVLGQIQDILGQMATAIALSASIAVLAGIAVLIGAIAASRQARIYDSVILKTFGATRRQILLAQAMEYGFLSALLALLALALGGFAGWYVIVQIFEFSWTPDWGVVGLTLAAGAGLTLLVGLAGSLPVLAVRPARALRQL